MKDIKEKIKSKKLITLIAIFHDEKPTAKVNEPFLEKGEIPIGCTIQNEFPLGVTELGLGRMDTMRAFASLSSAIKNKITEIMGGEDDEKI